jgi:hypothetical protein
MEKSFNKKPPLNEVSDFVVQRHTFSNAEQGADNSGAPPQGAGISSKLNETKHRVEGEDSPTVGHSPMLETLKDASSSGLSTQKASKSDLFLMLSISFCYGKFVIYSFITVKTQHFVKILITGNCYIIHVSDNMFPPSCGHHQVCIELVM